jgi:glucan phosphoethanolaminetransferase (alkaline phosphatase superfamily)
LSWTGAPCEALSRRIVSEASDAKAGPSEDSEPQEAAREVALPYYLGLWLLLLGTSLPLLRTYEELGSEWRSKLSYVLLLTFFVVAAGVVDSLTKRPWQAWLVAALSAGLALYCVASSLFMSLTASPLSAGLAQLGVAGSPLDSLRESELGWLAWVIVAAFPLSSLAGALVRRRLQGVQLARWRAAGPVLLATLLAALCVEQVHARETSATYFLRSSHLPVYWQLFSSEVPPEVIRVARHRSPAERERELSAVGRAKNPKHILIVGLESVRPDAIRPDHTPHLAKLREGALRFSQARSVSIYTALSWVSILHDRPAVSALEDLKAPATGSSAWPLAVLAKAGYRNHLAFSGNLIWGPEAIRRLGGDEEVGAAGSALHRLTYHPDDHALKRHLADDAVTETMVRWVEECDPTQPNLFLLQLDSTHWNYHFPREGALEEGYPEEVDPRSLASQAEVDRVHKRYVNAVHHVDRKIGLVLDVLERRGMLADTAVVVFSDHGEGFEAGRAGHFALCEDSQRIPLFFRLPGRAPELREQAADQRQVWPTLAEYLEIPGVSEATFQAGSVWREPAREHAFSAAIHWADLVTPRGVIRFRIDLEPGRVALQPLAHVDERGRVAGELEPLLASLDWRAAVRELNRSAGGAQGAGE